LKTLLPPQADDETLADPTDAAQRAYVTLLFNKYRGALLRHVGKFTGSREDAADIVQDTYLRVMNRVSVSRFDAETRSYLFQTATNLARDHFRRQSFRAHAPLEDVPVDALRASELTPEQNLAASQMSRALRAAIQAMPPQTRTVFLLARTREQSYEQIATQLGIGRRTVERRMAEAMAVLVSRLRGSL
jgi:RNA polymerase sigma factor (sigma-70 family)